jgi:hypothetical protein
MKLTTMLGAVFTLTLITAVFGLTACRSNLAHQMDNATENRKVMRYTAATCEVPQTGQNQSYASGDDGHLSIGKVWPVPRFTDNGNGTITDRLTGLMWTKNANRANGKIDWEQALAKSTACNDGGHTDWRLPNRNELTSLIDLGQAQPALTKGHPFNDVQSDYYWTSTTPANSEDDAWAIHFFIGFVSHDDKGASHYLWCVRSIQ